MEKNFHLESDFKVWKLEIDRGSSILMVELRDESFRETCFMAVALNSGEVLWDDWQFEENWWVNLVGCLNGKAVFQGYSDSEQPVADLIYVMDIKAKALLWQKQGFSLQKIQSIGLQCADLQGGVKLLDWEKGAARPMVSLQNEKIKTSLVEAVGLPSLYPKGNTHFDTIAAFLWKQTEETALKAIEYLELNMGFVLAYYAEKEGKMEQKLCVFSEEGKLRYADTLLAEAEAIGNGSFFTFDGQLVYVKNKQGLIGIKL